uniref:Uncharacterized protein n=1 Tax=Ceratitis capitata TaxID=7213 RepID=W8AJH8_CERCA
MFFSTKLAQIERIADMEVGTQHMCHIARSLIDLENVFEEGILHKEELESENAESLKVLKLAIVSTYRSQTDVLATECKSCGSNRMPKDDERQTFSRKAQNLAQLPGVKY